MKALSWLIGTIALVGTLYFAFEYKTAVELEALLRPQRHFDSILEYYQKQVAFWREKTIHDPYDFISARSLASSLMTLARVNGDETLYDEARIILTKTKEITPVGEVETDAQYARAIMAGHRFAEARDLLQSLIDRDPSSTWLRELKGDALWGLGSYDEALKEYRSLAAKKDFSSFVRNAEESWLKGDLSAERAFLIKALKSYRGFAPEPAAWIRLRLGMSALRYEEYDDALKFFNAALLVAPDYYLAQEHIAEVHEKRGEFAEAEPYLRSAIAIKRDPGLLARLSKVCKQLNKNEESAALHAEASTALRNRAYDGTNSHLRDYTQFLLDEGRNAEEAQVLALKDLEVRPGDLRSQLVASRAFELAGKANEARQFKEAAYRFGTKAL